MFKNKKLVSRIILVLFLIILTLFTYFYFTNISIPISVTLNDAGTYSVNSKDGVLNNQNFYVPKGFISTLSYKYSPPTTPGSLCAGANLDIQPTSTTVTARGWPIRYIYISPPLWCGVNNYTILPIAIILNTLLYFLIIFFVLFVYKKIKPKSLNK